MNLVVFKNLKNLDLKIGGTSVMVDPDTGEVFFDEESFYEYYDNDYFEALSERVGNIDEVRHLRQEVICFLGHGSGLERLVLSDGTSCGEILNRAAQGLIEVDLLRLKSCPVSSELSLFIDRMTNLIAESRNQDNPIVFV